VKNNDELFQKAAKETLEKVRLSGMKAGAYGILGAILDMCKQGKSINDIKEFCEKSLNLDGMK